MLLAAMVAGSAVSGYIVPTEAARLIGTSQIADSAITTPKIADGAVTLTKFGTGVADNLKGTNGINCWDLNGNGVNDPSEDVNNDNAFNALDCQGSFQPNQAPVVDAGLDQGITGTAGCGDGGIFHIPGECSLSCSFDISGSVTDDEFTGYLAHKWGPVGTTGIQFTDVDALSTSVLVYAISLSQITTSLPATITLTGDDGILTTSDTAVMTCNPPA